MRKIDVPVVRRHVGTFRHIAQVTEIALVYHLDVIGLVHTIDLKRVGFVDEVEQGREGIAKAHTTPATVADVVDAFQFLFQICLVPVFLRLPFNRMAGGRLQASFSHDVAPR